MEKRLLLSTAAISPRLTPELASVTEQVLSALAAPAPVGPRAPGSLDSLTQLANQLTGVTPFGTIETYVQTTGNLDAVAQELQTLGILVDGSLPTEGELQAWIPAGQMNQVAMLPGVRSLDVPSFGTNNVGAVTTLGDGIAQADTVRQTMTSAGIPVTGKGVKVGVISDGDTSYLKVVGSGDLPPNVINDLRGWKPGPGDNTHLDEGTAMLEIVHDVAPDASLYFSGRRNRVRPVILAKLTIDV
jgi:hypothetical protein